MANETKSTTTVTNETKTTGATFSTPLKTGSGLTWKESEPKTWDNIDKTWEELEATLNWTNTTKN